LNGTIDTGGEGANYFPGSAAGSVNTGGQYAQREIAEMTKHLAAGRVAAFGLILFIVGNELTEPALRQVLEILAGVLAVAGLLFQ
jgi:hypothetical protein